MLRDALNRVYTKFKLNFYRSVMGNFQKREASMTTVEAYCTEVIQAMNRPTINEFASFLGISPPNAAYKVNSMVQKGYLVKEQSGTDRREYHLAVTRKYFDYYNVSYSYLAKVADRIQQRFTPEDVSKLDELLTVISEELMPEIPLGTPQQEP